MHDRTQHRRSLRLDLDLDLDLTDATYSLHRVDDAPFAERPRKRPPPDQPHTASSSGLADNEAEGLDDILLRAIEPPDHTRLSLDDTLRQMKLTSRKKHCFKQLLTRVEMSLWTLHFQRREYERAYCAYLYEHAVARVRYALSIALVFVLLKTGYERVNLERDGPGALHDEWVLVLQLHAFVAVPVLAAVLLCTLVRRLDGLCELYGALPFLVVTLVLTAQKILLGSKGPVFALFLVFVPVFGITRFRFLTSVALAALMFSGHVAGLLLFQHAETATDVLFQAYNYFGGIVVGAVCHYRAEVLRRRNFVMLLPFCDEPLDAPRLHRKLHDPRLKKHALMARATLKFRNAVVEDTFYRHWYLIDPCPFDHPNAGELHRNVYRSVRFAVGGVIFAQFMLVVQDWEYLYADSTFPYTAYVLATCLRFTIVIPAYGISPFIMLFCGTRFYRQWREQAATQGRGAMRSSSMRSMRSESSRCTSLEASQVSAASVSEAEASTASYVALRSPTAAARNHQDYDLEANADPNEPLFRNNYVRFLQCLSTVVVFCHALAMGVILLLVDQLASQHNASAAPCYFLGFLNALLFPHRSGFRVRFVYATVATVCVGVLFVAAGLAVDNSKVLTYASYMALANILGMMVSHEEESLRRIFFVRTMLRSDEFRRRHDAILTLEPWFKGLIRARRRRKRHQDAAANAGFSRSASFYQSLKIPTVNQMVQASKVGMSLELGRTAIALLMELV